MTFITLGLTEMVHSFNIRSEESIFKAGLFKNKYLCLAFLAGLIMQVRNSIYTKYKRYIQFSSFKYDTMAIYSRSFNYANCNNRTTKEVK